MADTDINDILADDLLIEILSRLPCKKAIGFKSVCHRWNSIISSPQFATTLISHQTGRNNEDNKVFIKRFRIKQLIITSGIGPSDLDLSFDYIPGLHSKSARIVSSCNGLLLCHNRINDWTLIVCNPITKQWASIPPLSYTSLNSLNSYLDSFGFVCDPHYRIDDQGGVLLNPHCRFRIVCPFGASGEFDPQFDVDIFSSETGEWTRRWISRTKSYTFDHIYASNNLFTYDNKIQIQVGANIVIYDPFNNKVCGDIDPPSEPYDIYASLRGFSWSQNSLWMCQVKNQNPVLCVWRLIGHKDDNDQRWSLDRRIMLSNSVTGICRVLAIHPNNHNIVFLRDSDNRILSWDLEKRTTVVVGKISSGLLLTWDNIFILEPSLWPYFTTNFSSTGRISI